MKPRVFISAVSSELHSARQLVANILQYLGYEPIWQDILGTEQGDLTDVLRRRIGECHAVIQIVGFRYGAEPPSPHDKYGRVSYTQFEALYAHDKGKPVWTILCDEDFPFDTTPEEAPDKRELQNSYRQRVTSSSTLYHPIGTLEGLEATLLKLRNDLKKLRRPVIAWAASVSILLFLLLGTATWQLGLIGKITRQQTEETRAQKDETDAQLSETQLQQDETESQIEETQILAEDTAQRRLTDAIQNANLNDFGQVEAIETLLHLDYSYDSSSLRAIRFDGADLRGHDFSDSDFLRSTFNNGNLSNADLRGANLSFTQFRDSDLSGSTLDGVNAMFITASGANLSATQSRSSSYVGCDLEGADFSNADLTGSSFAFCDLRNADFTSANLSDTSFFGTVATGADFTDAQLENTHVGGTQLTDRLSASQRQGLCRFNDLSGPDGLRMVALDFWAGTEPGSMEDLFYSAGNMKRLRPSGWTDEYDDFPLCEKPDVKFPPFCCTSYSDYYQEVVIREKVGMGFEKQFLKADDNRDYIVGRVDQQVEFLKEMDFQSPYDVSIVAPNDGATISSPFQVRVSGSDNLSIDFFRVCVDATCVEKGNAHLRDDYFEFNPEEYAKGGHTITATGIDHGGNEKTDEIRVTFE